MRETWYSPALGQVTEFFLSCWPEKYRITKILKTGNICLVWKEMTNVGMRSKKSLSDTQPEHSTTIHHRERDRIGQNLQHWQHTLPAPSDRECWMKFWKYELTKQCPRRFSLHKIYSFSYSGGLSIVAGWYRNTNVCIQYWELRLQTLSGGKAWYNFGSVVFLSNDKAVVVE